MPEISPRLIVSVIALVVIIVLAVAFVPKLLVTTTTTTIPQQVNLTKITGCETVSSPGTYYFTSDINTSAVSGACILVTASNVWLVGNQHSITGNGPYTDVPPYSYGIELVHASNVSITGLSISRFSYGIFLNDSHNAKIAFNNLTTETLSGLYLLNSSDNIVQQNLIDHSQSISGGISLSGGSGNRFINNTLLNNVYYGMVIDSTGNNFTQNIFAANPADIVCSEKAAAKNSNQFSGSCTVNDYCGFATCATNVPFNFSALKLAPGNVGSCGSIYSPGNYTLGENLSTALYISPSNPLAQQLACIQIFAPNVRLDCNGKQISNSGIGIYVSSATNANITNCLLYNNSFGIYTSTAFNPGIANTISADSTYGIYLDNTTAGKLSQISLVNNTYGLYVEQSGGILFDKISASGNRYGAYVDSGLSDVFSGGSLNSSIKADIYCSKSTYNSSSDLAQGLSCGITDCNWASSSCRTTIPASLLYYPVDTCKTITSPGNYSVQEEIISPYSCFNIKTSNVVLNCNNHTIIGPSLGTAFTVSNQDNVTITNCDVSKFVAAVNVSNSREVQLSNIHINQTTQGVTFSNVSLSTVKNVRVDGHGTSAFNFSVLNSSIIANNSADSGVTGASGYIFRRAMHNQILFNNANQNPDSGFKFIDSLNNTILNNSAYNNVNFDYLCSDSSSWLYANPVGVNFGLTKGGCKWLVEISPLVAGYSCTGIFSPTQITLNRDIYYTAGATCFSVLTTNSSSGNNTAINCNGHTVYAQNGGTFLNIVNASQVSLSNCVLFNFSAGVEGHGALTPSVFNNTFASGGNAVVLNNGRLASVYENWIENNTNGILLNGVTEASMYNNRLYNNTLSIALYNTTYSSLTNNTASSSSVGIYLSNSTEISILDNQLMKALKSGITCAGSSVYRSGKDIDYGGNMCSSNDNCTWITASTQCRFS